MADIDIFGTLNNATPEGVIARADQIKDETQNKKQSEINAEVKEQIEQLSQGGSGGLEDAPTDGNVYGRKDGAWEAIAGFIDLGNINVSIDKFLTTNPVFDNIIEDGLYKFSMPNYYGTGLLEVKNINHKNTQTLRVAYENSADTVFIDYARRAKYNFQSWNEALWIKSVNNTFDLGQVDGSIENPFPTSFDNIKNVGEYNFIFPCDYASGLLKVQEVYNASGFKHIKQTISMDITGASFDNNITSVIYAVRIYDSRWTPWKKYTQTLEQYDNNSITSI